jgi:hypothetical protein
MVFEKHGHDVPGDKFESIGSNKGNKIAYLENKPI